MTGAEKVKEETKVFLRVFTAGLASIGVAVTLIGFFGLTPAAVKHEERRITQLESGLTQLTNRLKETNDSMGALADQLRLTREEQIKHTDNGELKRQLAALTHRVEKLEDE